MIDSPDDVELIELLQKGYKIIDKSTYECFAYYILQLN